MLLFVSLLQIIFLQWEKAEAKTIYVKNARGLCTQPLQCSGTEWNPLGSIVEAFSMVIDENYDNQDNILEIFLEPNPQNKPYIITDSDISDNPSLLNPFIGLRGKTYNYFNMEEK